MGFLRRLLGGPAPDADAGPGAADESGDAEDGNASDAELDAEERARDRELLREDAARLDDDLLRRQLRYADRSWTPPREGGERRSDDTDREGRAG